MKTALISGAAGGIGRQLCSSFARSDYRVIATDRFEDPGIECAAFLKMDLVQAVSSDVEIERAAWKIREMLGSAELSTLINNAAYQVVEPIESLTREQWEQSLAVNLSAPFILTRELLPDLERSGGSVINISSIHAKLTKPGFVAYATSKAALSGLTRALAVELGGRVRVNGICPAAVDTPMLQEGFVDHPKLLQELIKLHPVGRIGTPAEIAEIALFLASDRATFVNGCDFPVDGGISCRLHDPL